MTLARLSDGLFHSYLDRFLDGNLMNFNDSNFAGTNSTLPAVNVKESDNEFCIDVAAPGMSKEDFQVNYENGSLTITSEKKAGHEEKNGERVTRKEFSYQAFQRSFNVPQNIVNADKIEAKYEDGILHIKLPKREEARPKPAKAIKIS